MRNLARALLAGGLGFALPCIIAACGGGGAGLLSGDQANSLNNQLSQIQAAISQGHCGAAQAGAQGLVEKVSTLPSTVSSRLREDLDLGASTVSQLAAQQCHQSSTQSTTTTATTAPTTSPTTTHTAPTTTTPAPPTHTTTPATTTPTPPPTKTSPASGGGSLGGGSGGSGGGSGGGAGGGGGTGAKQSGAGPTQGSRDVRGTTNG